MRRTIFGALGLLLLTIAACEPPADRPETDPQAAVRERFASMEREALAEPYLGVVEGIGLQADLFPIRASGVPTDAIQQAACEFLDGLTEAQRAATVFDVDNEEWRKWSNVDNGIYVRQGVSLKAMTGVQREAAFQLLRVSLSTRGLEQSRAIMRTDHTLGELNADPNTYAEDLYFFTIMGEPSADEPWGWQLDGHHLIINFFVLGDQVVMTPVFMGAEPVITTSGKYAGNELLQVEQDRGLELMRSLSAEHRAEATISDFKQGRDIRAEANRDNLVLDYAGVRVSSLPEDQRARLVELIGLYVGRMNEGHANVRMTEVVAHLNDTWFAWVGETSDEAVFYYRIHSPVVLIEFDHQAPVGVPNSPDGPSRNHIHTVVRTPNGNDYGKDLLRQHLESHTH